MGESNVSPEFLVDRRSVRPIRALCSNELHLVLGELHPHGDGDLAVEPDAHLLSELVGCLTRDQVSS